MDIGANDIDFTGLSQTKHFACTAEATFDFPAMSPRAAVNAPTNLRIDDKKKRNEWTLYK